MKPADESPDEWPVATLQDYWRQAGVDEQDLISCDGKRYTKYHLPYRGETEDTCKLTWSDDQKAAVAEEIGALIQAASPVYGDYRKFDGPDRRAQLDGVVLPCAPKFKSLDKPTPGSSTVGVRLGPAPGLRMEISSLSLTARRSHLRLGEDWRGIPFGSLCDLADTLFDGDIDLSSSSSDRAIYLPGAIFTGSLIMTGANFGSGLQMREATLCGGINLAGSQFGYDAVFEGVVCYASFLCVETKFNENAFFKRVVIHGDVAFRGTLFSGIADFSNAEFLGTGKHASTIAFIQTRFERHTTFNSATLSGDCSFAEAIFLARTEFSDLRLQRLRKFSFESAIFEGPLSFSGTLVDSRSGVVDRGFLDVRLPSLVDCTGVREFDLFSIFDGATSTGRIDFHGATLKNDYGFQRAQFRALGRSSGGTLRRISSLIRRRGVTNSLKLLRRVRASTAALAATEARDARLRALEGGCRTIKLAAESVRDRVAEQLFYRYELIARRDHSATPRWERAVSRGFAIFSDYGASIARPLMWLFGFGLGFAALYWIVGVGLQGRLFELLTPDPHGSIDKSLYEAISLAGEAMFRPFFIWTARNDEQGSLGDTLFSESGAGMAVGTRVLCTLQSFISVTLVFLSALAVRRRFQIT